MIGRCLDGMPGWVVSFFLLCTSTTLFAEEPLDPALRRPWVQAEQNRMLDWLSGLQKKRGAVQGHWWLQDRKNRSFELSVGDIEFYPLEAYSFPVPSSEEAPLHMAEALALYEDGYPEEAARIWKSFLALRALPDRPAYQTKASVQAANNLQTKSDFTGPVVLYLSESDRTLVSHPEHGFRFSVASEYAAAYFRLKNGGVPRDQLPGQENTVALRRSTMGAEYRKEVTILVSSDSFRRELSANACKAVWRERLGISPARQNTPAFAEEILSSSDSEILVSRAHPRGGWLELYRANGTLCLHIQIIVGLFSPLERSMENALELEGAEFKDPLESLDLPEALRILDDIRPELVGP